MTGEEVLFWVVAPISVLGALGVVWNRKAVHSVMCAVLTMLGLAILYVAQDAAFLGIVQAVVYTGAIMMLFLFVVMLIGVDASDSLIETIRGQRVAGILAGLGVAILLVALLGRAVLGAPKGLILVTPDGNIAAVADKIFTRYVWSFEVTSALLITAALGAMVLAHRERIAPKPTQRELSIRRFRDGTPALPPSPGVYARHNAVDTPGLLPDGSPAEVSVSSALIARGDTRPPDEAAADVPSLEQQVDRLTRGGDEA